MQIHHLVIVPQGTQITGNHPRGLPGTVVRGLNRQLCELRNLLNIVGLIHFLEERGGDIRQHVGVHADMDGQLGVVWVVTADRPTVERGEELGTGADVAPLAQGIDLEIVGVVDAVTLEVGDSLVIVVAVLPIRTAHYPKVVQVG